VPARKPSNTASAAGFADRSLVAESGRAQNKSPWLCPTNPKGAEPREAPNLRPCSRVTAGPPGPLDPSRLRFRVAVRPGRRFPPVVRLFQPRASHLQPLEEARSHSLSAVLAASSAPSPSRARGPVFEQTLLWTVRQAAELAVKQTPPLALSASCRFSLVTLDA
jgi:hypothetical protein